MLVVAARALLRWTQKDLSKHSGIGITTIADFERGARKTHPLIIERLAQVMERNGIRFVYGLKEIGVTVRSKT